MTKKISRKAPLFMAACMTFALVLAGCGGTSSPADPSTTTPTFTVTFNSAGGSAVAAQTVEEGGLVQAVTSTRAWHPAAGLWLSSDWDSLPTTYTFGGWRHGNEAWDFTTDTVTSNITLTAQWTAPTVTATPVLESMTITGAIAHVNANTVPGRAYTLAISQNVNSGTQDLNQPDTDLTIVGIGGPREIRFTASAGNQSLFEVGRAGTGGAVFDGTIRLTLGNNITLVGRTEGQHGQANNGQHLIRVRRAKLFMEDGARITGHTNTTDSTPGGLGAAVNVGAYGIFTMNGGIITGNRATYGSGAGGVFVTDVTSRFYMKGGSITGNYRGTTTAEAADVLVVNTSGLNALYTLLQANPNIGVVTR